MKILHVVRGLNQSSGTTHAIIPMAEEQARRGHDVWLYYVRKPAGVMEATPDPDLVRTDVFDMSLPFNHPGVSLGFASAIARNVRQFDIVHIQAVRNFVTWWTMICAVRAHVPFIVAPQGSYENWNLGRRSIKNQIYDRLFEIPWLNHAARIHCLTEREVEQVRAMGIKAQCVVIPNGVNVQEAKSKEQGAKSREQRGGSREQRAKSGEERAESGERRVLLFLGRIHPKKGLDLLIPAFAKVAQKIPHLQLVIAGGDAGNGYLGEMITLARSTGLSVAAPPHGSRLSALSSQPLAPSSLLLASATPNSELRTPNFGGRSSLSAISFLGEVKGDEKEACFAQADVFLLPSYSEGLPVAALEAMAHGLPVILTDSCNLREIQQAGAGVLAETTVESVADAIGRMFTDDDARLSHAEGSRRLVEERFAWPKIVERVLAVYQEMR